MKVELTEGYPYMYETHCHSSESSACAVSTAVEMAKAHKDAGYTGMILTNHNWGGNTAVSREREWTDFLERFFEPYHKAKAWGDANDFQVFPGYEAGYDGTEFLIYGLDIEWMMAHPELKDATIEEQLDIVHSGGGIVVHAHPFREAFYIKEIRLYPKFIDGVEAVNATHSSPYSHNHTGDFNKKAVKYAKGLGVFITGGSDTHSVDLFGGGMAFPTKLKDMDDFVKRLLSAKPEDYIVTDGRDTYDAYGGKV
ncbi:MAG: histidinol-phosphatase [Lachnospiraceae bacterium]|nr:histidinol-phosphatase [Lachnospiraceae bacterium]